MKPAREPASSRLKPCSFLEKPHESCPFAAPCGLRRKKKKALSDISFSLRNVPVRAFDSRAQGFSTPLARRRSSCPPPSLNLSCTVVPRKERRPKKTCVGGTTELLLRVDYLSRREILKHL